MRDIVRIAEDKWSPSNIAQLVAKAIKAGRRTSEVRLEVRQQEGLGNSELGDIVSRFLQSAADGERVVKCIKLEKRHFASGAIPDGQPTVRELAGTAKALVVALSDSAIISYWVTSPSIEVDKDGDRWLVVRWESSSSYTGKDPPCAD